MTTSAQQPQQLPSTDHLRQVLAARVRVKVDPYRGVDTPQWIRDLAAEKV
jgi:hypothetical protein